MEKIAEKPYKILQDLKVLKENVMHTKNRRTKTENVKSDTPVGSDLLQNKCCFCLKIFLNSKFLLKHVLRRHSEDLVSLYRDTLRESKSEKNDVEILLCFLEKQFLSLKNDITSLITNIGTNGIINSVETMKDLQKTAIDEEDGMKLPEELTNASSQIDNEDCKLRGNTCTGNAENLSEILEVEDKIRILRKNLEELQHSVADLTAEQEMLKNPNILEENILNIVNAHFTQFQSILATELQSLLFEQIKTNNMEWKRQILKLEEDVIRLSHVIETVSNQINSPLYLQSLEKKLEKQLTYLFLDSNERKHRTLNQKSKFAETTLKKPVRTNQSDNLSEDINLSGNQSKRISKQESVNEANVCDQPQGFTQELKFCDLKHIQRLTTREPKSSRIYSKELESIGNEKMGYFNVSPDVSKLSSFETDKIFTFLNMEKSRLTEKYPEFVSVYDKINSIADEKVVKLKNKRSRKLRFSEPLHTAQKVCKTKSSKHYSKNKTFPFAEAEHPTCNIDFGGAGDCKRNFIEVKMLSSRQLESTNIEYASDYNSFSDRNLKSCAMNSGNLDQQFNSRKNLNFKVNDSPNKVENNKPLLSDLEISKSDKILTLKSADMDNVSLQSLSSWEDESDFSFIVK